MMSPESPLAEADMNDDLLTEYEFDYHKAGPNRFATQQAHAEGSLVVVLEPDIAQVFTTPEAVKAILRAIIANMPKIIDKAG